MRKTAVRLLLILVFLLFLGLAAFSGYQIYGILEEYRQEENTSEALQQFITFEAATQPPKETAIPDPAPVEETAPERTDVTDDAAATEVPTPTEEPFPYPTVDFDSLKRINEDIVGWILIEDTKINYPIVQGTDNQRYMNHMADGKWNPAGSIFLDYRNEADFSDVHSVLYGHHMKNGSMFAGIDDYRKKGFLEKHPTGMILTPEKNFQFEVVAGYVAEVTGSSWQLYFETDEAYDRWLQKTLRRSVIGGSFQLDKTDRIITLSTCAYDFEDARFVLVCRIME